MTVYSTLAVEHVARQSLVELLSLYPDVNSSLCNSFEIGHLQMKFIGAQSTTLL